MDQTKFSTLFSLKEIQVTDSFWKKKMELVRKEVIPYQWAALNDQVEGATPSFCMRNFKTAGNMNRQKIQMGSAYKEAQYTFRGFEALPEDLEHPEDNKFYGFVFQDSDFSKWIEAVAYSLTQHPDPELEKLADGAIDIVCEAQQEDGYLDTYYIINGKDKIFSNLRDYHELYCFGHLTEGAVAYYQATGKDKLLQAAKRFADYIADYFGLEEDKCKGYPGHEIAEMALVRLYEATGEQKYLDLSSFFIEQRGTKPYYFDKEYHPDTVGEAKDEELRYAYHQAHLPVREQKEAVGHAVRGVYLYSGMADMARLTKDDSLYAACENLWNDIVEKKIYITGGVGATQIGESFSFAYDLPNDTAYAETCASVGMVFFTRRMLEIKPDAKYANVIERELYNGALSGMALDGKSFFYVNPLEVNPVACHKDERKFHVKPIRQKWFGCACCPTNLARLVSSLGYYAFTENESTLFVHLYVGSKLTKFVNQKEVNVEIQSEFPWDGHVKIKVNAQDTDFVLALRIPDWCKDYQLEDANTFETTEQDGYLYLKSDWKEEDTIHINFPMEAKLMTARSEVREDTGKVAIMRGPIVYCMEEVDNGENLHLLSVNANTQFKVYNKTIDDESVKAIEVTGVRTEVTNAKSEIYSTYTASNQKDVTLQYVPYYIWANRGENEMQVWTSVKN